MDVDADAYNEDYSDAAVAEEIAKYRNIVLSACSSLGNLQPNTDEFAATNAKMVYVPAKDCLASLKDIKRYIQMDEQGDGKLVLQWLGEWQVLERDIIPIFTITANHILPEQTVSDTDALKTVMMCVELFVFLTWSMESESDE
ncbi:Topoisomerase 1-associated factor 1, partial [Kickxella alabastrina]